MGNNKRPTQPKQPDLKEKKPGEIIIPDFKLYYKAIVIRSECYWHKNRHIEQWKRIKSPEIDPCIYMVN